MSIISKLYNKLGKKKLFIIEAISSILGFVSTYVLSYLTSKYAKEKGRTKFSSFIKYIGVIDVFLTGLIFVIYPEGGKTFFIVSMYIASALCNVALLLIQNYLFKSEAIDNNSPEKITKTKKIKVVFLIVVLSFTGIVIVGSLILAGINEKRHIVDTNGPDNYELQTLEKAELILGKNSYFGDKLSFGQEGDASGADYALYDYDNIHFKMERITGTAVLQTSRGLTDTLVLNFDTKVHSGNCEIVILHNSKIYQRADVNTQQTIIIENAKNKEFTVVLGAESANVEIYIDREFR